MRLEMEQLEAETNSGKYDGGTILKIERPVKRRVLALRIRRVSANPRFDARSTGSCLRRRRI